MQIAVYGAVTINTPIYAFRNRQWDIFMLNMPTSYYLFLYIGTYYVNGKLYEFYANL